MDGQDEARPRPGAAAEARTADAAEPRAARAAPPAEQESVLGKVLDGVEAAADLAEVAVEGGPAIVEAAGGLFEGGCCLAEAAITPDCFVATATLGDPRHPDLDDLRRLRDRVLLRTGPGRRLVHAYYHRGAHVARWIRPRPALRFLVRNLVVRPAAALSRLLLGRA
ncbi:hypothetical protein M0638_06240 [Roseomonas sp. NAR14]|uniref:Uncharacterized protein n=1 Tax=Roseomonas acroporae TaxID=2937791 RepID=A0A9X1Y5T4_9PROT|nr:CFI-box-CTERM domain-containing protein [Roseomonas acroporae]MCK8783978.1 hypothetical protein [Roseomonas acroporae]